MFTLVPDLFSHSAWESSSLPSFPSPCPGEVDSKLAPGLAPVAYYRCPSETARDSGRGGSIRMPASFRHLS